MVKSERSNQLLKLIMVVLQFLEYLVSYVQILSQDLYQHYRILPYHTRVKLWCLLKDNFPTFKTDFNKINHGGLDGIV